MRKRIGKRWLYIACLILALAVFVNAGDKREGEDRFSGAVKRVLAQITTEHVLSEYTPLFSYARAERKQGLLTGAAVPLYAYCMEQCDTALPLQVEAAEDFLPGQETEMVPEQNAKPDTVWNAEPDAEQNGESGEGQLVLEHPSWEETGQGAEGMPEGEDLVQAMEQENQNAALENAESGLENLEPVNAFVPHVQSNSYDWTAMNEYQTLMSTFYTVDAGTMIGSNQLDIEKLQSKDMTIEKTDPAPQILIYHTHSRETFADSVPGDRSQTVVGVGDRLTEILTEQYGYGVLHHTEEYDTVRDQAYAKSLPAIEQILEENPSIQVVIDLHRDAGIDGVKRAIELDGRPTATFMLFNGLSRSRKTGDIEYLYNPYLDDNLAFSFQMQVKAGEYYPGLTRKIYLKAYRYNMHLMPKTLLIELGDSNNTVEEVMNTCDPLAHVLDMVLSGEE